MKISSHHVASGCLLAFTSEAFTQSSYQSRNLSNRRTKLSALSPENVLSIYDGTNKGYVPPPPTVANENLNIDISKFTPDLQQLNLGGTEDLVSKVQDIFASTFGLLSAFDVSGKFPILASLGIAFGVLYSLSFPSEDFRRGYEPYGRGEYDPISAISYYKKHPLLVIRRSAQIFRLSNKFIFSILVDKYIFKNEEENRKYRAKEALALIELIGPTAIKVGQALSVRPDLIPSEYSEELSKLQDRVPPFPSEEAKALLEKELAPVNGMSKFTEIDLNKPVASASIGQVYKGKVRLDDGTEKEVAVKVQRPDVLAEIALDLFLVREFAPIYAKLTKSSTDLQALANEWGRGFIAELTYMNEAKATMAFRDEMQKRGLTAVTAPVVVEELSTDRILCTEWVDGNRLDQSNADDVPRLCGVALNAYLVMLLEIGNIHCDPHPGNLIRTTDGKLCILDFGMVLETSPSLQYDLLDFISHLTSENYDIVPDDLVKLGFLKEEKLQTVIATGFLEPLTYMLKQASEGGGGSKIRERIIGEFQEKYPGVEMDELRELMREDMKQEMEAARKRASAVTGITMEVEELQKQNSDAFTIPEWFLYTSRAFLTLEGISLQANEDFSLISSCFPYVARRLLGDDSPRAQKALRDLLYGASDGIDAERLKDTFEGFSTYTTTSKIVNQEGGTSNKKESALNNEAAIILAKDTADIILAPEGNLVQNILIDESALSASANIKDALKNVLIDTPEQIRSSLPFGMGNFLPKPLPLEPFLKKSVEEERAQKLTGQVASMIPSLPDNVLVKLFESSDNNKKNGGNGNVDIPKLLEEIDVKQLSVISKELQENLPIYAPRIRDLGGKFASTTLLKLSDSIEQSLKEQEHMKKKSSNNDIEEQIVRASAGAISNIASRSAKTLTPEKL